MDNNENMKNLIQHHINMNKLEHSDLKLAHHKLKHEKHVTDTIDKERKRKIDHFKNLQKIMSKQDKSGS